MVESIDNSSFVITVKDDEVNGQIVLKNQLYNINTFVRESNYQTLTWIDRNFIDSSHFKNDTSVGENRLKLTKEKEIKLQRDLVNKSDNKTSVVRVLFFYGSDVINPVSLTANIVTKFNTVLQNSNGMEHKISVAGIEIMNTDFGTDCRFQIEDHMELGTSYFSNIGTAMTNHYADMAVTVAKGDVPTLDCEQFGTSEGVWGRVGGVAFLFRAPPEDNSQNRYANFADNYALGDLTAIHEIGHVFGGLHATQQGGYGDPYPWNNNQAIVSADLNEQTIMGGYQWPGCDFVLPTTGNYVNQACIRKETFSKLQITGDTFNDNSPTGSSTRDNKTYIRDVSMPEVSEYSANPPIPGSAPSLSVTNYNCFGENHLDWSEVNLANSYEVFRSENSGFNSPLRIYNGMNSQLFVDYKSIAFYRVKACNEGGCSGYSNQVTGVYINGCQ